MGLKENQKLAEQYPILQHFKYAHLPEDLQKVSAPFCTLAWKLVRTLPYNAELSTALRKLLEAKDAAVRAALDEQTGRVKVDDTPKLRDPGRKTKHGG